MKENKSFFQHHAFRFVIVGIINTLLDIGIYTILRDRGLIFILANFCSTSVALIFSFVVNRRFTFNAHGADLKGQMLRFFPVTVFGLWAIQPLVIYLITHLNSSIHYSKIYSNNAHLNVIVPKLGSAAISLAWNYIWYKKYVFADKTE